MSIILARKVGFCFGVKRAVEMAEKVLKKKGSAYSLGSIIHNAQVVEDLTRKGLKVIKRIDDVAGGLHRDIVARHQPAGGARDFKTFFKINGYDMPVRK